MDEYIELKTHLDQRWMSRDGGRAGRPLVVIPARFSEGATVLRHRAEVNAAKLVESVLGGRR